MATPPAEPTAAQCEAVQRASEVCRDATAQLNAAAAGMAFLNILSSARPPLKELQELQDVLLAEAASRNVSSAWPRLLVDSQLAPSVGDLMAAMQRAAHDMGPGLDLVFEAQPSHILVPYVACCNILAAAATMYVGCTEPHAAGLLAKQLASAPVFAGLAATAQYVKDHVPGWSPSGGAVTRSDDARMHAAAILRACSELVWQPLPQYTTLPLEAAFERVELLRNDVGNTRSAGWQGLQRAFAAREDHVRTLAALRDSGVLSALCAAVLAAPPYTPPARNGPADDPYLLALAGTQYCLADSLRLVGVVCAEYRSACAVDVLAAPPVLQFRMLSLMQLVASRQQMEAPGSGPAARIWPLLRRDVLRALEPTLSCGGLTGAYDVVVSAAAGAFQSPSDAVELLLPSCGGSGVLTPAAVARRIFPPPQRAAALLSRASAAVCSRLEYLADPRLAEPGCRPSRDSPLCLSMALANSCNAAHAVLQSASSAEAAACTPDVLTAQAWGVRAAVSSVGRTAGTLDEFTEAASCLACAFLGGKNPLDFKPGAITQGWERLGADVQAACARALLPTRLMASLDTLLRHLATRDLMQGGVRVMRYCSEVVPALLPALLRARLLPTSSAAGSQPQGKPERSGEAAAAAGSGSAAVEGTWRPQDELGVLVTAAKLARQEAARLAAAGDTPCNAKPGTVAGKATRMAAALSVLLRRVGSTALPPLLLELDAARQDASAAAAAGNGVAGGGAAALRATVLSEACRAVAEAMALCYGSLLQLQEAIVRSHSAHTGALPPGVDVAAKCALQAARHLSAGLTPAADPRRLLTEAARLFLRRRQTTPCTYSQRTAHALLAVKHAMCTIVLHLSADEALLAARAPGWLWAEPPAGADAQASGPLLLLENLAALADAPDATPPGPVVVVRTAAAAAALGGRPWAEHAQCRREVTALARSLLPAAEVEEAARVRAAVAAALASGGSPPQPPRLLKLCANPRCGSFAGAREADLKLQLCSGCRTYRYCGAACVKAHWPQHKAECKRLAAAAAEAEHAHGAQLSRGRAGGSGGEGNTSTGAGQGGA